MTAVAVLFLAVFAVSLAVAFGGDRLVARRARQRRIAGALAGVAGRFRTPDAPEAEEARPVVPTPGWLQVRIERAGLDVPAAQVMRQIALCAAGGAAAAGWLASGGPLAVAATAAAAATGPLARLAWLRARRLAAFRAGLPDALDTFARGLRAGRALPASLDLVVRHGSGVVAEEFARCLSGLQLGQTLAEVFGRLALRIDSAETRFLAIAVTLQAEKGGNLVETAENMATLLRDRRKLARKAAALTAEVRASALILAALPLGVGLLLLWTSPDYVGTLFTDPRGRVLLGYAVASVLAGVLVMQRMGRADV